MTRDGSIGKWVDPVVVFVVFIVLELVFGKVYHPGVVLALAMPRNHIGALFGNWDPLGPEIESVVP